MSLRSRSSRIPAAPTLLAVLALTVPDPAAALVQGLDGEVARHVNAARSAAGDQHGALFNLICPLPEGSGRAEALLPASPGGLPSIPGGEPWQSAPVRVFDNLHYVGQSEYSAWAVTTSEGIIVIDALFDYSVESQIEGGLRALGLDPNEIRYVIVSHGHGDHVGGAAYLQERFGARIVLSEADWGLVERSSASWPKPRRDIVAEDGHVIRLGDTTVTLYLTPGHTPGTLSSIVSPVRDGERTHVAAAWGGTAFNFQGTDEYPRAFWLETYGASAARFREVVGREGADVLFANHPRFDGTPLKLPRLAERRPSDPHPFVVGNGSVSAYLTVAEECARATALAER